MGTENALMAAAATHRHHDDPQRRLRAARAGPRAHAQQDGRGDRGHRLQRDAPSTASPTLGGCEHTVSPDHIEIASFMALAGVTGGELRITDCVPEDLRMIRMVFRRLGLRLADGRTATCFVRGGQKLRVARDAGDYQSKVEDGPWPAFPADLTSIARRARHPVRGQRPDLREDVREPPVLRGQADLDGRGDHDLRPAPGDRHRPAPAARRARVSRRTSAPAWRC